MTPKSKISSAGKAAIGAFLKSRTPSIYIPSALNPDLVDNACYSPDRSKIFSLSTKFISPSEFDYALPTKFVPEFAFIGRSNVGKSSLVGTLLNNKKIVRVSKEPGCTRSLNYYSFQKKEDDHVLYFVDMPGYGFAKVSKSEKTKWGEMINSYLKERSQAILRLTFCWSWRSLF